MTNAYAFLVSFFADKFGNKDRGATAVEYGLMVALIAVAIITTVGLLGDELNTLFTTVTTELAGA